MNNDGLEQDLRLLQLHFIGKILAGFTHEMKNYLAIINESAGLMGDMIQMGKSSEKDLSEYLDIIRSVEEQIKRANEHCRALNRFAHRMDNELSSFDLNECIGEIIALLTRFANQRKITLIKNFQEDLPPLHSNPSLVQFIVFSVLDEGLQGLEKDTSISLHTAVADQAVQIKITPEGNAREPESDVPSIPRELVERIIARLNGSITRENTGEILITLSPAAS